jgi:Zn-dependent alcohol dehydrogenase
MFCSIYREIDLREDTPTTIVLQDTSSSRSLTVSSPCKVSCCHKRAEISRSAGIDGAQAAPFLCGGVTVYSPLKQYGAGPGKAVGVIGLGGLGVSSLILGLILKL